MCFKGPIHDQKNGQYFEAKNGRPIFDKIFDTILPTHVPSKFWSKFIVLKMFDPDAAVAVALVLAKCSPEDWIFDPNFDRSPHTRQNIEELSKYWRLLKICHRFDPSIFWVNVFFDKKISHTRSIIQSKFWWKFFSLIYWRIFWLKKSEGKCFVSVWCLHVTITALGEGACVKEALLAMVN